MPVGNYNIYKRFQKKQQLPPKNQKMGTLERKQQLKKFLQKFDQIPITLTQTNKILGYMQEFIISYFGKCFIEGYRIIQKISENIFLLSLMEFMYQPSVEGSQEGQSVNKIKSMYRIICVLFQNKINTDKNFRIEKYKQIINIIQFFSSTSIDIQTHIIFANNFQYTILTQQTLLRYSATPGTKKFYDDDRHPQLNNSKYGLKIQNQLKQGLKLHQLVQLLLKGSNVIYNQNYLKEHILHYSKFQYNLPKIINTIYFIIGKQVIEGNYTNISVEKWMRKFSKKQFKRFDLLLRNQNHVCIIDWKFSKINAIDRIASNQFTNKNKQYLQLARKQYNAQVSLKFYCFHQPINKFKHKHTTATYNYNIENIQINDQQENIGNQNNQIQIESDSVEIYADENIKGGNQHQLENQNKKQFIEQIEIQSDFEELLLQKCTHKYQSQNNDQVIIITNPNKTTNKEQSKKIFSEPKQLLEIHHQFPTKLIKIKDQNQIKYNQSPIQINRRIQIQDAIQDLEQQSYIQLIQPPNKISSRKSHLTSNNDKFREIPPIQQPLFNTISQKQHHIQNINDNVNKNKQEQNQKQSLLKQEQMKKQKINDGNECSDKIMKNCQKQQQVKQLDNNKQYQLKQIQLIIKKTEYDSFMEEIQSTCQKQIQHIIISQSSEKLQNLNQNINSTLKKSIHYKQKQKNKMGNKKKNKYKHYSINKQQNTNNQCKQWQIYITPYENKEKLIIQISPSIQEITNGNTTEGNIQRRKSKRIRKMDVKYNNIIEIDQ